MNKGPRLRLAPPCHIRLDHRMRNVLFSLLALPALSTLPLQAEERPLVLPFDLSLGGVKAVMEEGNILFATIGEPVEADAELKLQKKVPMLIINAFPCDEDGTVHEGQPAAVIFIKDTDKVKLDATIDGKVLKPGTYLANVVAESKTSRIVFTIPKPDEKKKVDFSKIFAFLSKKKE